MVQTLTQILIKKGAKLFPNLRRSIQLKAGRLLDDYSGTMSSSSAEDLVKKTIRNQFKEAQIPKKSLGGLTKTVPPKKGPNSQVPPVKLKGGGCAIRGTKFKGVF